MEGRKKKERVMAAAVFVLAILLSAQRLPVGVADPTKSAFCQCYVCCYEGCKVNDCSDCCAGCYFPGDPDFENGCRMSGGKQAPVCGTEATGGDTICITAEGAAANYWSRRHGEAKAKAKHG